MASGASGGPARPESPPLGASARPGDPPRPGDPGGEPRRRLRSRLRLLAGALLATAAVLVARVAIPRVPHWRALAVEEADGATPLRVDEIPLGRTDLARLGGLFAGAAAFETGSHAVTLAYGDDLVVRLLPGSRVVPRDAGDGSVRLRLEAGALQLAARAEAAETAAVVATPELEARPVGAALLVQASAEGSRVLVARGAALVVPAAVEALVEVAAGSALRVARDGPPLAPVPEAVSPDDAELASLRAFGEAEVPPGP